MKTTLLFLLAGTCAWQCSAQPAFDSSGNGLLNGGYYMREVFYFPDQNTGVINEAVNVQGTITFNGGGSYSFSGSLLDSATGSLTPVSYTASGTYVISASGEGHITAVNPNLTGDNIVGLVSHGVFIGSSTETVNGYNDLFIATPIGSVATNATLSGTYSVAYLDPTFAGDATFSMTADGQGNIGNVNITGYLQNSSTSGTETLSGVTYSFSNGAAQLKFGGTATSSNLIAGTDLLYISPDGNFVFGGNFNGYDMFVGVRAATSTPTNYDGLYYQAGLDFNLAGVSSNFDPILDSYYGSINAVSGDVIGHQRLNALEIYGGSSDYTYFNNYTLNTDGTSSDGHFNYTSTSDGTIRIGYGIGPYLGINVAFQAPSFTGSGVYLSPVGVVNAASSAPFTAFVSPGEFLTLYGTGLAPTTASAIVPFPTNLSGVQVLINDIQAPIYYVSPTQISVIVPYITSPNSIAQIQVINNDVSSNIVTQFTGMTSVGVFGLDPATLSPDSVGDAAAEHADGSVVTKLSPAQIGETIAVYLTGMGAVSPAVNDGVAAPSSPLSNTTSIPTVIVFDANGVCPLDSNGYCVQPTVAFSGLAPGYAGLYQLNFTIPAGLASGDGFLEVVGPDSDTFEVGLPIGSATSAVAASAREKSAGRRKAIRDHSHALHRQRTAKQ